MKIIPFTPSVSSWQEFSVNLGEYVCRFTMRWNPRASEWFCDFATSAGTNSSVAITKNRPLLGSMNVTGLSGDFRLVKTNRAASDTLGYDSVGTDWSLVYGTHEEWEVVDGV